MWFCFYALVGVAWQFGFCVGVLFSCSLWFAFVVFVGYLILGYLFGSLCCFRFAVVVVR